MFNKEYLSSGSSIQPTVGNSSSLGRQDNGSLQIHGDGMLNPRDDTKADSKTGIRCYRLPLRLRSNTLIPDT